jgi:hypothetical protein
MLLVGIQRLCSYLSFQRKRDCEGMDAEANVRAANGPKGKRQDCRASSSSSLLLRRKALPAKAGFPVIPAKTGTEACGNDEAGKDFPNPQSPISNRGSLRGI